MEGKFAADGLQGIDGDDDMLTAMARELVENRGIGESADSVWRSVGQLQSSTAMPVQDGPFTPIASQGNDAPDAPLSGFHDMPAVANETSTSPPSSPRVSATGQLSLF